MRKPFPDAWIFRTSLSLAAALLPSVPADAAEQMTAAAPLVLEHPPITRPGDNSAHCLAFLDRDGLLASGAASGVLVWDIDQGKLQRSLAVDGRGVDALVVDRRGAFLVAGCASGQIKVWDTRTWKEIHTLGPTGGAVRGLALSPDGTLLASAGPDGQKRDKDFGVLLWDLASGRKLRTLPLPPPALGTTVLAFWPDGKRLIAGQDQALWIWDVQTGQEVKTVRLEGVVRSLGSMALSPDGRRLATGIFEPRLRLWNTETWQPLLAWEAHGQEKPPRQGVTCVAYSPDGKLLLSGGMDGRVGVWQAATGQSLLQLDPMTPGGRWVTAVAMSADGTRLAAANMQGFVTIWRINPK